MSYIGEEVNKKPGAHYTCYLFQWIFLFPRKADCIWAARTFHRPNSYLIVHWRRPQSLSLTLFKSRNGFCCCFCCNWATIVRQNKNKTRCVSVCEIRKLSIMCTVPLGKQFGSKSIFAFCVSRARLMQLSDRCIIAPINPLLSKTLSLSTEFRCTPMDVFLCIIGKNTINYSAKIPQKYWTTWNAVFGYGCIDTICEHTTSNVRNRLWKWIAEVVQ